MQMDSKIFISAHRHPCCFQVRIRPASMMNTNVVMAGVSARDGSVMEILTAGTIQTKLDAVSSHSVII